MTTSENIAATVCPTCGINSVEVAALRARDAKLLALEERQRERSRLACNRLYKRRRSEGLCVRCGLAALPGLSTCLAHKGYKRKREKIA